MSRKKHTLIIKQIIDIYPCNKIYHTWTRGMLHSRLKNFIDF